MNLIERKLLQNYSRAVIHIREQIKLNRFGLVLGAGTSCQFGFPKWSDFINQIAKNKEINGDDLISISGNKSDISQLLYQKLKTNCKAEAENFNAFDKITSFHKSKWLRIIHDELYKNVPTDIAELKKRDKYIKNFLGIIKKTRLTINYNFDNTIELLLSEERTDDEKQTTRGYRTVWNADIQLYPQNGVIYHPNGYIPRDFSERPSDDIVFLEDSFGDQLIDSISGHYNALSNYYSQNTCLLIGLSLDDATLKHILRNNSKIHPGHVHYYIYYINDGITLTEEQMNSIRDSNFEVYNLITLFLNDKEISAFAKLINTDRNIGELFDQLGETMIYRFFLTGSVSVGKSTTVSNFRSLKTHDEWLENKIKGMEKDPNRIEEKEIEEIDRWVAEQWRSKNYLLTKIESGIHIIDRAPLDAFAFTPNDAWISKAKLTKSVITPEKSKTSLCSGKIILMIGDAQVMSVRALKLQKDVTPEELDYRQNLLKVIYDKNVQGIVELDTRGKSIERVTKDICRIIHLDEYHECNLQQLLDKVEEGTISPNN